jgi:hypothetical protein
MPLGLPPPDEAGGVLQLEYSNPSCGERHGFTMHLAHFDALSFAYLGTGPKAPSEADISVTYAALGALWATFYPADWTLRLISLLYNDAGDLIRLPVAPTLDPILGASGATAYVGPTVRRLYRVRSVLGRKRRVWIQQIEGVDMADAEPLSATAGGVDGRDQALIAYLSGPASGVVAPDGYAFKDEAVLRVWSDRALELVPPPTGPGPFLVSG